MDWGAAMQGISRDVSELMTGGPIGWLLLVLIFALPAVLVVVARRRPLAWLALAVWLVPVVQWVIYYGRHLPNVGIEVGMRVALLFPAAWLVLGVVVLHGWLARRRAALTAEMTRVRGR